MTAYRRNFIPGGSFFFTVNLADRRLGLLTENVDALRAAFRITRQRHPFAIEAIVILPDHRTRSGLCRTVTATSQRGGG